jgi:hypothetical protein
MRIKADTGERNTPVQGREIEPWLTNGGGESRKRERPAESDSCLIAPRRQAPDNDDHYLTCE